MLSHCLSLTIASNRLVEGGGSEEHAVHICHLARVPRVRAEGARQHVAALPPPERQRPGHALGLGQEDPRELARVVDRVEAAAPGVGQPTQERALRAAVDPDGRDRDPL